MDHADHQIDSGIHVQKTKTVSRRIAFLDFDGTITSKDTMLEMLRYTFGPWKFMLGFLLNSPFIVAYKLGIISNHDAKQRVLRFFFGKFPVEKFNAFCLDYAVRAMPLVVRGKALHEIGLLKGQGAEIVVVSASPENWLRPWCDEMEVQLLATRLEVKDGRITGNIAGQNCYGEEKVRRIREAYDLSQYQQIWCYGDTSGDKPMLELATFCFYKPFR
nr:HAD-IB family hydrolase [Pseudoflavitalea sp. G-6-1-2]